MRKRVLFWTDSFLPSVGGVEVLAAQYLRALKKRGTEFTVVTRCESEESIVQDEFEGTPVYRLGLRAAIMSSSPRQILNLRRAVTDLAQEFQPDLLHIYHIGMGAMLFDGAHRIPRLMTLHEHIPPEYLQPNTALSTFLSSIEYVACCSQSVANALVKCAPSVQGRSGFILNALEVPELQPTPISLDPPRLLAIGRLVHEKGFDTVIDAFAMVRTRFPALRLTVAGNGPALDELKSQVDSLGLNRYVDFLGWVAPHHVPALISSHTLVVMPTRNREPFGLVALQTAQMARPVVASNVGGLPEVIKDGVTGLLVAPNDPRAFASAIESLLNQPIRATEMGLKARDRALNHFTWSAHIDAYESLMQRLISDS